MNDLIRALARADEGDPEPLLAWCASVAPGQASESFRLLSMAHALDDDRCLALERLLASISGSAELPADIRALSGRVEALRWNVEEAERQAGPVRLTARQLQEERDRLQEEVAERTRSNEVLRAEADRLEALLGDG